jgi:hypothetical protein
MGWVTGRSLKVRIFNPVVKVSLLLTLQNPEYYPYSIVRIPNKNRSVETPSGKLLYIPLQGSSELPAPYLKKKKKKSALLRVTPCLIPSCADIRFT